MSQPRRVGGPPRVRASRHYDREVPVAAVFEFGKEALDAYDQMLERHADVLGNQPHRRMHVCFETDDGYMVVDVWDSLEDFEEFGDVLQSVVAEFPYRAELKLRTIHKLI